MNEQLTRQAYEMFGAAKEARIPESVQALAEDSVVKAREAYTKMNVVAKEGAKVLEEIVLATHSGAKAIGEKVFEHSAANARMAFDAAQAVARAKTLPEAAKLQAEYIQRQFATGIEQTSDLFQLSTRVTRQTFDSLNAAATKSFEQLKNLT